MSEQDILRDTNRIEIEIQNLQAELLRQRIKLRKTKDQEEVEQINAEISRLQAEIDRLKSSRRAQAERDAQTRMVRKSSGDDS